MKLSQILIGIMAANALSSILWPVNSNLYEHDNYIKTLQQEKIIYKAYKKIRDLESKVESLSDLLYVTQETYERDMVELSFSKSKYVYVDHSSMKQSQFKEVIEKTLLYLDLYSEDAVHLLMVTAAVESDMGHLNKQIKGPALGIFQILPSTEEFILKWLDKYPNLKLKVMRLRGEDIDGIRQLRVNIAYQVAMSILVYIQRGEPIPNKYNHMAIIEYYRKNYNTNSQERVIRQATEKYNLILKMEK